MSRFSRHRWLSVWSIGMAIFCASAVLRVEAHGPYHEQIRRLDEQLSTHPGDPALLLQRGEYHRLDENWAAALADLRAAEEAGATPPALAFARACLAVSQGRWEEAEVEIPAFTPTLNTGIAWRVAATISAARGDRSGTLQALRHTIERARPPLADDFLRLSAELSAAGDLSGAQTTLAQSLDTLGLLPPLVEAAAALDLKQGRLEQALARFTDAAARKPNSAWWLARRGDLAAQAGRNDLARIAWSEALAAWDQMPAFRRQTPEMLALRQRLATLLAPAHDSSTPVPSR